MSSILLVVAIVAMGLVIFWYVFDEAARGGEGRSGFLGMIRDGAPQRSDETSWRGGSGKRPWRLRGR